MKLKEAINSADQKIIEFFKNNPNPPDSEVHKLADDLGINAHKFEEMIYRILSLYINK